MSAIDDMIWKKGRKAKSADKKLCKRLARLKKREARLEKEIRKLQLKHQRKNTECAGEIANLESELRSKRHQIALLESGAPAGGKEAK